MEKFFSAKIIEITKLTADICYFKIQHNQLDYSFNPGQWIDLKIPEDLASLPKNIGGFTIISLPNQEGFIELAIRNSHHPVANYLHTKAKLFDQVLISEGQGKFFLADSVQNSSASIVLIAGGIGITPLLSMARQLIKANKDFQLLYFAKTNNDFIFQEELKKKTHFITTSENHLHFNFSHFHFMPQTHFYICGPKTMIDQTYQELTIHGVSGEYIHFEKWW